MQRHQTKQMLMFLSFCRVCLVSVSFCFYALVGAGFIDVPLIFSCPADHVPDWQPRIILLGMVEARSVNNVKNTLCICSLLAYAPTQTF